MCYIYIKVRVRSKVYTLTFGYSVSMSGIHGMACYDGRNTIRTLGIGCQGFTGLLADDTGIMCEEGIVFVLL